VTRIDTSEEARAAAERDFGGLVEGHSTGVLRARSAEDVVAAVTQARREHEHLTIRGGGLGQSGQSVAAGSVTLDVSGITGEIEIDAAARTAHLGAGTTFRALMDAALPHGLLPQASPLSLDITVGGILSAGGFGSTSHRFGPVVATVEELEVVAGTGDRVVASPDHEPDVWAAVLGGLGRCAVITSARLRLRPAGRLVRTAYLLYDDVEQWFTDQQLLVEAGRADQMEASCSAAVQGFTATPDGRRPLAHWLFGLQVTRESDDDPAPAPDLDGLSPWRVLRVDEDDIGGFMARYDGRFAAMRATGAWDQPHPWFECLLPAEALPTVVPRLLEVIPLTLGDGHRVMWLGSADLPPLLAVPDRADGGHLAAFTVLPTGVAPALVPGALEGLDRAWSVLADAGAKRYLSGYLGRPDQAWWRTHFGDRYDAWAAAKRTYDPDNVFCSALFPPP
jgi:cytokinin dehydrogenase